MLSVFFTSLSGWVQVVLMVATISLPYLLRGDFLKQEEGRPPPYLLVLRPHYWIGYGIAALAFAHAGVAMLNGLTGMVNLLGVYLATAALALIAVQVLLGLRLRKPRQRRRPMMRRWHFWSMISIAALGFAHVMLNSAMMRALFR